MTASSTLQSDYSGDLKGKFTKHGNGVLKYSDGGVYEGEYVVATTVVQCPVNSKARWAYLTGLRMVSFMAWAPSSGFLLARATRVGGKMVLCMVGEYCCVCGF